MPVGSQSPTLMEFVRHLEGQDNDLMSQHEPRDDTDTSVTEALTSLRIEEADVQPVQEARPPVRFSDTLQLANLAQMLNDLAADPSFTIQGIPPDDWPRWKDHLKSDVRAVMPVARKEDMDRRLVDAWKTTFPNSAVPGSVIRKIKIGVKELRRHQAVEDGERGPGGTRDEYFELAIFYWILDRNPTDPEQFNSWTNFELDMLLRITPLFGRNDLSHRLYEHGPNIQIVLDALKANLASTGKGLKDVLELKFSPGAVQEILDFHAKSNTSGQS